MDHLLLHVYWDLQRDVDSNIYQLREKLFLFYRMMILWSKRKNNYSFSIPFFKECLFLLYSLKHVLWTNIANQGSNWSKPGRSVGWMGSACGTGDKIFHVEIAFVIVEKFLCLLLISFLQIKNRNSSKTSMPLHKPN